MSRVKVKKVVNDDDHGGQINIRSVWESTGIKEIIAHTSESETF